MKKTIKIDGKDVVLEANALTPIIYRRMTGRDLFVDISGLQTATSSNTALDTETLETFLLITHTMAKQADASIPDSSDEWLAGFEMFSIYNVLPQIIDLWYANEKGTSKPKKK